MFIACHPYEHWRRVNNETTHSTFITDFAAPADLVGDRKRATPWHSTGKPPKTRAEKLAAVQTWDSMNKFDRPPITEWLETHFGLNEDGSLAVGESTFHGWRKLKKP